MAGGGEVPRATASAWDHLEARLRHCATVYSCALQWYLLSVLFSERTQVCTLDGSCFPMFGAYLPEERRQGLWKVFVRRVKLARYNELAGQAMTGAFHGAYAAADSALAATRSGMLLLSQGAHSERPEIAPFLQQLRCYARTHGLELVLETEAHGPFAFWERHLGHIFTTAGDEANESYAFMLWRHVKLALKGDALAVVRLANSDRLLVHDETGNSWRHKPRYISRHLSERDFLVYLDTDVTVRPDAYHVNVVHELQEHSWRHGQKRGHQVYVRDPQPHVVNDCINSGFLAVRNAGASKTLLKLWEEKLRWPGTTIGDQSALAESLLELLALEKAAWGPEYAAAYRHECLPLMFPVSDGVDRWWSYCECWHRAANHLTGKYRRRSSQIVGFVSPERIDINFVPLAFLDEGTHTFKQLCERRVEGDPPLRLTPFLMHWAGMPGDQKLRCMVAYLSHFNASLPSADVGGSLPVVTCPQIAQGAHAASLAGPLRLGVPEIPDHVERSRQCRLTLRRSEADGDTAVFDRWWFGTFGCSRLLGRPLARLALE